GEAGQLFFERAPIGLTLPRDLRSGAGKQAARFLVVAMLARQVLPDHAERPCAGRIALRGFQERVPGRARRAPKSLDEEFLFRVEMVVETADREPRPLHDVHYRACFDT